MQLRPSNQALPVSTGSAWTTSQKALAGVVVLFALLVSFFNLGSFRTLTSHEAYVAVSTREMLVSGDWIVPRFGGVLRLTKPPLGYWAAALCTLACGGETTEFSTRLPSALSGLALVALVGWWGSQWYGRSAGLCAALIQGTSLYHLLFAREATVDMLQCVLMTWAMFLAAFQPADEIPGKARLRWLGIYALLGVLALAKFHFGPVLVLAPVVLLWCLEGRWRACANLCNPLGILVFSGLAFLWPLLILRQIPEAYSVWQRETLGRAFGELPSVPWWYFLPQLAYLMVPWSVLLPVLIPDVWRRAVRERNSRDRFLCVWILVQTLLLSMSSNKHRNYLIPALPAVAILLGPLVLRCCDGKFPTRAWASCLVTVLIVAISTAVGLNLANRWPTLRGPIVAEFAVVIVGGLAVTWLLHWRQLRPAGLAGALTYAVCLVIALLWLAPGRDHRLPGAEFARKVRQAYPGETLRVYLMEQATVVFYLGLPVQRDDNFKELRADLATNHEIYVLGLRPQVAGLERVLNAKVIDAIGPGHPNATHQTEELVLMHIRSPGRIQAASAAATSK